MPWWMKFYSSRVMAPELDGTGGGGGGGGGGANDEAAKAAASADEAAEAAGIAAVGQSRPTDAEAKLIKEVMAKKDLLKKQSDELAALQAQMKQFDGINVEAVKKLMADQKAADEKKLADAGEWERLKKQMAEENERAVTAASSESAASQAALKSANSMIADLTVGSAFAASAFVKDDIIVPVSKARLLFGPHFEFVNGAVVGYDKPAGATERTVLVDASGEPLSFEAALRKIIEVDPDRDGLLRSKVKPGAGSTTTSKTTPVEKRFEQLSGRERIAAALAAQK